MKPDIDPFIQMRAGIDQAMASFRETAPLLRGHFTAHVAAGFTEAQALALTRDFQRILLSQNSGADDDAS